MVNKELNHAGIIGMKWGRRRYQNKDGSLTPEGRKRYGVDDRDDPKSEGFAERKKRALQSGNVSEVLKYSNHMTTNELNDALNRIRYTKQLQEIEQSQVKSGFDKVEGFMNKVGRVTDMANKGINAYNVIAKVNNTFNDKQIPVLDGSNFREKMRLNEANKLKEQFLKTASDSEILEKAHMFTNQELQDRVKRNSSLDAIKKHTERGVDKKNAAETGRDNDKTTNDSDNHPDTSTKPVNNNVMGNNQPKGFKSILDRIQQKKSFDDPDTTPTTSNESDNFDTDDSNQSVIKTITQNRLKPGKSNLFGKKTDVTDDSDNSSKEKSSEPDEEQKNRDFVNSWIKKTNKQLKPFKTNTTDESMVVEVTDESGKTTTENVPINIKSGISSVFKKVKSYTPAQVKGNTEDYYYKDGKYYERQTPLSNSEKTNAKNFIKNRIDVYDIDDIDYMDFISDDDE